MENVIISYTQLNSTFTVDWQIFQFEVEEAYHVRTRTIETETFSKVLATGTFDECLEYLQNNID